MAMDYQVRMEPLPDTGVLRDAWLEIEAKSQCSFFTSWTWIGSWLALVCPPRHARMVSVHLGTRRVALGVFTARRRFFGLGPMHLRLHETGDHVLDSLTIEYNGLVCESGHERQAMAAVIDHFAHNDSRWLTLYLPGMEVDRVPYDLIRSTGLESRIQKHAACYVDLALLREGKQDYMATVLSSKARGAVRRTARKLASHHGDLEVSVAAGREQRLAYFHAMANLHETHWTGESDEHGAFNDPRILHFHERLISECSDAQGPQLIRLSVGGKDIGYVYTLVWRGTVYFYQAGIDYQRFGTFGSPGLLLLVHAIEHALADGHDRFELMAGDAAYKHTLAMAENKMAWLSLDRPGLASRLRRTWWSLKRGAG
jgi:CelD/BcsL family acetyltransferase involved in cellulose biosynthesis